MNLDVRTVIFSYLISDAICAIVIALLWRQNRKQFHGLGFWLADFVMQFSGLALVVLRGIVPDMVSMVVGNGLVIGGTILLFIGLERFAERRSAQWHNLILILLFVLIHSYFVLVVPSLTARNINLSLGLLAICAQCAWLALRRVDVGLLPITRSVGLVLAAYCLVSIVRIFIDLAIPSGDDLFRSNLYDTLALMIYQMLFIALTFALFMMVSQRLAGELVSDIARRKQVESALKFSEEKFSKAFHASPDAIIISRTEDGRIVEVNDGFSHISGYLREEAVGNSTLALNLWADRQDRDRCITAIRENGYIYDYEYDFVTKLGKPLRCLYSGEQIELDGEMHILSIVRDITERKRVEAALRLSEERYRNFIVQSFEAISRTEFDHAIDITLPVETQIDLIYENAYMAECNQAMADMYHVPSPQAFIGMRLIDAHGGKDNPTNRAVFRKLIENGYKSVIDETIEYTVDGKPIWFLSNTIGIVEQGHLVRLWGTAIDITERKQAEEAVARTRKLLASTLSILPVGVCLTDESGHYRIMNDAYCAIYEYDRDEMLGQHYSVIMPPDQIALANAHYARLLSGDVGIPTERKRQRKDGSVIYIEAANALVEDVDGQKMVITTVRDITERKRRESILQVRLALVEFAASHSADEILQHALDEIGLVTESPTGFYHFVEPDQITLSLQAWSTRTLQEFCQAEGKGAHYPIDQAGVWVDCVRERKPVIHNDYTSLPHRKGLPPGHAEVRRELVVPIFRDNRVVAIVGVGNKSTNYDQTDVGIVANLGDVAWEIVKRKQAEASLHQTHEALRLHVKEIEELHKELREQAVRDPLTGLYNRRYLAETMPREVARVERDHKPLSVIVSDIDHFKILNDTYGHQVGDLFLVEIANLMKTHARESDIVCRYGGEEFLLVIPGTTMNDAYKRAEELRYMCAEIIIHHAGQELKTTMSFGVSTYPIHDLDSEQIIMKADRALYQSKNSGRNRVTVWNEHQAW